MTDAFAALRVRASVTSWAVVGPKLVQTMRDDGWAEVTIAWTEACDPQVIARLLAIESAARDYQAARDEWDDNPQPETLVAYNRAKAALRDALGEAE